MAYNIIYWLVKNTQIPTWRIFVFTRCKQLPSSHFSHTYSNKWDINIYGYIGVCVSHMTSLIVVLLAQTIQSTVCVYNIGNIQVSYLTTWRLKLFHITYIYVQFVSYREHIPLPLQWLVSELLLVVKGKQSLYRTILGPERSRKLRLPDFETVSTWRW
jgi:hypothetical protein